MNRGIYVHDFRDGRVLLDVEVPWAHAEWPSVGTVMGTLFGYPMFYSGVADRNVGTIVCVVGVPPDQASAIGEDSRALLPVFDAARAAEAVPSTPPSQGWPSVEDVARALREVEGDGCEECVYVESVHMDGVTHGTQHPYRPIDFDARAEAILAALGGKP